MSAETLLRAADLVERGWWRGGDGKQKTGDLCSIEALAVAAGSPYGLAFRDAKRALTAFVGVPLLTWNYQAEGGAYVARTMRAVAARMEAA